MTELTDDGDFCHACQRNMPLNELMDAGMFRVCIDPQECKKNWLPDDIAKNLIQGEYAAERIRRSENK